MVLLDLAWRTRLPFRVFTLDTGRLPEETYTMLETARQRYGIDERNPSDGDARALSDGGSES